MALPPTRDPFSIYIGDDYAHVVTFVDEVDGVNVPRDVSGSTFAAQIRLPGANTGNPVLAFNVDDADAADGAILLSFTSAQTVTLEPATYRMDMQQTTAGVIQTVFVASVPAVRDVTR
jgi:hypothetical protein